MNKLLVGFFIVLLLVMGAFKFFQTPRTMTNVYVDAPAFTGFENVTEDTYFIYFCTEDNPDCETLKPDVEYFMDQLAEFTTGVGFYYADMALEENQKYLATESDVVYTDAEQIPDEFNLEDIKVDAVAPTMLFVTEEEIISIGSGVSAAQTDTVAMGVAEFMEINSILLGFYFEATVNSN